MTDFRKEDCGGGGQSGLPASTVFSDSVGLRHSICQGAAFGAGCSKPHYKPDLNRLVAPDACLEVFPS